VYTIFHVAMSHLSGPTDREQSLNVRFVKKQKSDAERRAPRVTPLFFSFLIEALFNIASDILLFPDRKNIKFNK
jgi:hypothetical protein